MPTWSMSQCRHLERTSPSRGCDWAAPGFVWNMSKRLFYYNDTAARRIYVFDCDDAGVPDQSSRRILREFSEGEGQPDVRCLESRP